MPHSRVRGAPKRGGQCLQTGLAHGLRALEQIDHQHLVIEDEVVRSFREQRRERLRLLLICRRSPFLQIASDGGIAFTGNQPIQTRSEVSRYPAFDSHSQEPLPNEAELGGAGRRVLEWQARIAIPQ